MNIPNQMNYIDMNRDDAPNLVDQFRKQVAEAIALEREKLIWKILCSGRLPSETKVHEQMVIEDGVVKYRCWAPYLEGEG